MSRLSQSRFWELLLDRYPRSPSIALCRVPEVEYLAALELEAPLLDHCCGDGYIADLAFPGVTFDYGVDLSQHALELARVRGKYQKVVQADAGKHVPVETGSIGTIINNSGLEHIEDLDGAVAEIARMLRPGGWVHFNVLNSRYFAWWPRSAATASDYRRYQPFHHALDEGQWRSLLLRHGMSEVRFRDYLPRHTAQTLADYDYRYSAFYFRRRFDLAVALTLFAPTTYLRARWRNVFGGLEWDAAPGTGAGFLVSARRAA